MKRSQPRALRGFNLTLTLSALSLALPLGCQSGEDDETSDGSGGFAGGDDGSGGKKPGSGGRSTSDGGSSAGGGAHPGGGAHTGGQGNSGGSMATGGAESSGGMAGSPSGGSAAGGEAGAQNSGTGGAGEEEPCDGLLSEENCEKLALFSPLGEVPPDPTNAYADDPDAAVLGQMFFFDPDFSGKLVIDSDLGTAGESGKVACASCHSSPMMSDDRSPNLANVSLGANFHSRNAPALVNSSFYEWTNWGGRFSRQWELPMPVTESGVIMNSTRLQVAHVIYDQYKDEYEAVFGDDYGPLSASISGMPATGKPTQTEWDNLAGPDKDIVTRVFANYAKALAAYTRLLVSKNSPFDQFVAGDYNALTPSEIRGLEVFLGPGGCTACHGGTHFSDDGFHNIGVAQTGPNAPVTDNGRIGDIPPLLSSTLNGAGAMSDAQAAGQSKLDGLDATNELLRGAFRTPTLRGLVHTAPYMHTGQLATLEDVVEFYDRGGDTPSAGTKSPAMVPLGLTQGQKDDLVEFLMSLTGDPVPDELLEDTSL